MSGKRGENRQLLCAAFVAPMDQPVIPDGAMLMEGDRIAAVGTQAELRSRAAGAIVRDLGEVVVTPGLVNAHVHLELSDFRQGDRPASFVQWLLDLMAQGPRPGESERIERAAAKGAAESVGFGVTTVGDISKQCTYTRPALRNGPLRVVSFGEIQAMARRRVLLEERFAVAADVSHDSERLRAGISPHAPYTVEAAGYARCLEFARERNRVIATHLAETPEEAVFLKEQTGPFRHLWEVGVNAWDSQVPLYDGGPIQFARDVGLLAQPALLAHVNYCDDSELAILAGGLASVVYCPRTHAYFGHGPHRWREMLGRGINVAVGTDSRASSPDLNLLDDLRLLHRIAPEVDSARLWEMATIRGARALNMQERIGSLTPGKLADLAAFPCESHDPLMNVLESNQRPTGVWIGGESLDITVSPG